MDCLKFNCVDLQGTLVETFILKTDSKNYHQFVYENNSNIGDKLNEMEMSYTNSFNFGGEEIEIVIENQTEFLQYQQNVKDLELYFGV